MKRNIDFTTGPIVGPLLRFAVPVLFAMFLQVLYGAVDLMVVGRFATSPDVSGVSIGAQLMMTVTNIVVNFSMGSTIYLGQKLGEGDRKRGGDIIGTTIIMFSVIGLALSVLLPIFAPMLAGAMNTPEESFVQTVRYIRICGAGSIMIVAYNIIGAIFRGIGDSTTPLITVAIAAVINIVGDLALVAGVGLGSAGAAIATVASQTISVIISLFLMRGRQLPFEFSRSHVHYQRPIAGRITRFGFPIALQDFMVSMSFLIILVIVNTLGVNASAGVGVAQKICGFIMLVPLAFMQSMSSFVAQNKGADKPERAYHGLKVSIELSAVFGVFMFWLAFFHGDLLCQLFSKDAAVVACATEYLKAYAIDCLFTCIIFCMVGFLNGIGKTFFVMLQGIVGAFVVRIPAAFLLSHFVGSLFSIGLAIPISSVSQILICLVLFWRIRKTGI